MKKQILFLTLCIALLLSGCQKTPEALPAAQTAEAPWETGVPDAQPSYAEYFAETRTYDTADYTYSPAWLQTGDYEIDCRDGELALFRTSDGERLAVYTAQPFLSWRTGSSGVYVFREQDILRCAYDGSREETLYTAQNGTIIRFAAAGDVLFFAEKTDDCIRLCRLYAPEERLDILYDAVSPDAQDFLLFPVSNHEICWSMDDPAFLKLAAEQKQTYIETRDLDPDDQSTYWGMLELDFGVNSGIRYYYNDLEPLLCSQGFRKIYGEESVADWWKTEDSFLRDAELRAKFVSVERGPAVQAPDRRVVSFLRGAETALAQERGLTFNTPEDLSPEQLFQLFLAWTNEATLKQYQDPDDGNFYFTTPVIRRTLDCYFSGYCFDITACRAYDRQTGMVVVPSVSGSDDGRTARLAGKAQDGDLVTYLIDFYADAAAKAEHRAYARKEYTLQCYDGGFYLLCACSMMCPDGEYTLGGISVWDRWDLLPQAVTEGFAELGVVGVSREDYDVVKYGRDGLYVHVLRLQAGKEDWEGLDGYVSCVYTTSPDYPSPRGLRVGDPEANAAETMNALWGSFEYELQDGAICRMGFFSYYDAGGPGEAFTVRPADSRPGN